MNRTRRTAPLLAASSLSLLFLAGCPNAGSQPPLPGTGTSAPASAAPQQGSQATGANGSGTSGTAGQATTGATSTPGTAPASGTSQPGSNLGGTTVRGTVYDENAAAVDGATVRVQSLNTSVPFDTTITTSGGSYVVNGVPAGVQVAITATKANWTSRTRVVTLLPLTSNQPNTVDFGGTNTQDTNGQGYFISDYPEISALSPSSDSTLPTGSALSYKITFSEPLDTTNQRRVADALQITSTAAVPSPAGTSITINDGSYFGVDTNTAQVTWDSTGTTMTLTFPAVLYSSSTKDQTYLVRLLRSQNASPIEDAAGHALGYTAPSAGSVYKYIIATGSPTLSGQTTGLTRWEQTHASDADFKVAQDNNSPKLTSVSASPYTLNGTASERFALTFNVPMIAYGTNSKAITGANTFTVGSVQNASPASNAVNNYQFVMSKTSVANNNVDGTPTTVNSAATASSALTSASVFTFDSTQTVIQPSTSDPKTIWIIVPSTLVPTDALYFKVEAKNIQDPGGNPVSTANSNGGISGDNIQSGQF